MYISQHCDKHTVPWRQLWRLRLGTSGRLAEVAAAAIAVATAGTREGGRGGGGVRWRLGAATEKQRMRKAAEGGGRRRALRPRRRQIGLAVAAHDLAVGGRSALPSSCTTGSKGQPVATLARPSVQVQAGLVLRALGWRVDEHPPTPELAGRGESERDGRCGAHMMMEGGASWVAFGPNVAGPSYK